MSLLSSLRDAPAPSVAIEVAASRVSGASLEWRGGQPVVSAHAMEPLAPGVVTPSLTGTNLHDRPAVAVALNRVLERLGYPRRIGLIIPDVVAKVSLVRFEQTPDRAQDLDQLIRWQVRKAAPFPIEEAQVSYVAGQPAAAGDGPSGQEFVVSLARREVVEEYEQLCAAAGAHAGLVDLATLNVINGVLAGTASPAADWLLVNVAPEYATIAILRGPHLLFFRNRSAQGDGTLGDLVHQTTMYYQDRLSGTGFARVMLSGVAASTGRPGIDVDEIRRSLENRTGAAVESVDPRNAAAIADRISPAPALLDALAPLVGLLLRDRRAGKAA
jgi:Tfp pilus assembly PilM family ATPase